MQGFKDRFGMLTGTANLPRGQSSGTEEQDALLGTENPTTSRRSETKKKKSLRHLPLEEQVKAYKTQVAEEKAGKRKLFHSLVKLANELRKTRQEAGPLMDQQAYRDKNWYEGGMWRAPTLLPGVQHRTVATARQREAISLSSLFFHLVIVTAFTRVGTSIGAKGYVDLSSLFYFAIIWTVWSKESSYSTRFDTTDLSAQIGTLTLCFAVLFATLSVQASYDTIDGTRIMMMAAYCAAWHLLLHVRVALSGSPSDNTEASSRNLNRHITNYAVFNIIMNTLELSVWCVGIFGYSPEWSLRWVVFVAGIMLALRVPRAFLANDFHAACSKRGVLFILLLGFLLQSLVVVAGEFFEYQTPTPEHYAFVGSACLMFFCIKLLYVDDSDTLAEDHALLVNRWAGFFFNIGQFSLLLSTTIMGSGLNLLTHEYLAASASLPGPSRYLVCGGFSATLCSTLFIKSMHLKRVPTDARNQVLFIAAYILQTLVLFAVVIVSAAMFFGKAGDFLNSFVMQNDIILLFSLSGAALLAVLASWLDEGVELLLYQSAEDSRAFRIHPFGFWWCLKAEISDEEFMALEGEATTGASDRRLSALSPLLGESMADLKYEYESTKMTPV